MIKDAPAPARPKLVLLLLVLGAAAIVGFAGLLRFTLRTAFPLNPADYELTTPAGFRYACTVSQIPGAFVLEGYAFQEGQRFHTINTFVVLHDTQTGRYYKLPTAMQVNPAVNDVVADGINYSFGGFYAFLRQGQLKRPAESYEICVAYRSTFQNALVHTGQMLAEVSP